MSDRIAVMDQGRVLQIGTPVEIYEQPASRFIAEFIGESNLLDGTALDVDGAVCSIDIDGTTVTWTADPEQCGRTRSGGHIACAPRNDPAAFAGCQ